MRPLPNRRHEWFVQYVAAGIDPADAYVKAGYTRSRANHHRLKRKPRVAARIEDLRRERERVSRAARTPLEQVLQVLRDCVGVDRVADFFERNASGALRVRDLRAVPVHVATALLWSLQKGMDVRPNFELAETDLIGDGGPVKSACQVAGAGGP
jgi:hypothetical protein